MALSNDAGKTQLQHTLYIVNRNFYFLQKLHVNIDVYYKTKHTQLLKIPVIQSVLVFFVDVTQEAPSVGHAREVL